MNAATLVQKLWNYCNVLRDDGMSYGDYVEQLTYLLFLKMADERSRPPYNQPSLIPKPYAWPSLLAKDGDELFDHYRHVLEALGNEKGTLALIQAMVDCIAPKPNETICDPACGTGGFLFTAHNYIVAHHKNLTRNELRRLKEEAFRGWELVQATARVCAMNLLLHGIGSEKNVPIKVTDALAADPGERFEVVLANPPFGKKSSTMIVGEDGKTTTEKEIIERDDFWATTSNKQLNFVQHIKTLLKPHGRAAVVVPDNVLFEGGAGETIRRKLLHECDVHTLLRLPTGLFYAQGVKANVIFFDKKPASETPWTKKLWIYDLRTNKHFTLKTNPLKREDLDEFVRLYNPANRYDRKPTWIDEKVAPLPGPPPRAGEGKRIGSCRPQAGEGEGSNLVNATRTRRNNRPLDMSERDKSKAGKATRVGSDNPPPLATDGIGGDIGTNGRWRVYEYDELVARDKASLDIFWLKDDSLADSDNLPPPEVIAQEIVDDLEAALEQFRLIAGDLNGASSESGSA